MLLKDILAEMSRPEYNETERIVHSIFDEMGVNAYFSHHMWDRVEDGHRDQDVTPEEIIAAFVKLKKRYGTQFQRFMASKQNLAGVLKDVAAELNIPLALELLNRSSKPQYAYRLQAITLMRKPTHRFHSVRPTDVEFKV